MKRHLKNLKDRAEDFVIYLNYKLSQEDFIYKVEEIGEIKQIMSFLKSLYSLIFQMEKSLVNEAKCNFQIASLEEKFKELRQKQAEENSTNQTHEEENSEESSEEKHKQAEEEEVVEKQEEVKQIPKTIAPKKETKAIVEIVTNERYEEEKNSNDSEHYKNQALQNFEENIQNLSSVQIEKMLKEIRLIRDFRAKDLRLH